LRGGTEFTHRGLVRVKTGGKIVCCVAAHSVRSSSNNEEKDRGASPHLDRGHDCSGKIFESPASRKSRLKLLYFVYAIETIHRFLDVSNFAQPSPRYTALINS
jgi:hypothetical protein